MSDLKQTMQRAREFIAANLAECCRDELDWQNTALLRDGKLREASAIYGEVDETHAIPLAQAEVARQAMQFACRTQPEATAERTTYPVSQITDETIFQIAKRELRSEGNLFEGDADEVAVFVRECLAAAAPHAQAPAEQQESIDTPEFWRLYSEWREAAEATRSVARRQRQAWIAHIDAHTAAAVAKAGADALAEKARADSMESARDDAVAAEYAAIARAERAEAALAQPVDLSKLERYKAYEVSSHSDVFIAADVEQLLAAAPAAQPQADESGLPG